MGAVLNIEGERFGSLTATKSLGSFVVNGKSKGRQWECLCDCGGVSYVFVGNLRSGNTTSCGMCATNIANSEIVGKIFTSKSYGDFVVLKYHNSLKVDLQFISTGFKLTTDMKSVKTRSVRDTYFPKASGVGYFGVGEYPSRGCDGKNTEAYEVWLGILKRCYNKQWQEKQGRTSYRDCDVDPVWHNFQTFAEWYYLQPHVGKGLHVDKDLLVFGNRVYSPEFCTLVPIEVNSLFTGSNKVLTKSEFPIGVHFCKSKKMYIAQIHRGETTKGGLSKQSYLGQYETLEEAVLAYSDAKKQRVREVAEKFKDVLDPRVYLNLVNYSNKQGELHD